MVCGTLNPNWAGLVEAPPNQTGADEATPTWAGLELVAGVEPEPDVPAPGGPETGSP